MCCSSTASLPEKKHGPEKLWVYDLRTNKDFSLKTKPLRRSDLDEFVTCFQRSQTDMSGRSPGATTIRRAAGALIAYSELLQRDKVSLDIFWLRDESLEDSASLPAPDVLAAEIIEDLEAALDQFAQVAQGLERKPTLSEATAVVAASVA